MPARFMQAGNKGKYRESIIGSYACCVWNLDRSRLSGLGSALVRLRRSIVLSADHASGLSFFGSTNL